jgi:hypothetical protein
MPKSDVSGAKDVFPILDFGLKDLKDPNPTFLGTP